MKISVIIPVYNTRDYLVRCFDSIINQTIGFSNIEMIIINDGSEDNSENIIRKYIDKYPTIQYIKQKNSGQSVARNNGLKKANGEFISFVDSDDYIDLNMYQEMYNISNDKDIIVCDHYMEYPKAKIYKSMNKVDNKNHNFVITNACPWNMIIRKSFLEQYHFSFPEGIIYEDLACIPVLGALTNRIEYVRKPLYYYCQRNNSTINNKVFNKKQLCRYKALEILENSFTNYGKYEEYHDEIEYLYIISLVLYGGGGFIKYKESQDELIKIKDIMDTKFPRWKKNKYYLMENRLNKWNIKLLYNNRKTLFMITKKINNIFKRIKKVTI